MSDVNMEPFFTKVALHSSRPPGLIIDMCNFTAPPETKIFVLNCCPCVSTYSKMASGEMRVCRPTQTDSASSVIDRYRQLDSVDNICQQDFRMTQCNVRAVSASLDLPKALSRQSCWLVAIRYTNNQPENLAPCVRAISRFSPVMITIYCMRVHPGNHTHSVNARQ